MRDHGTYTRYAYHGCRCAECKDAKAAYQRAKRRAAKDAAATSQRLSNPHASRVGVERTFIPGVKHGSAASYQEAGCRCWDCTEAYSAKRVAETRRRRQRAASP